MELLFFGGAALSAGIALLAMGFYRRSRAAAMKGVPCRFVTALVPGERQFISGKARSPVLLQAPLSKKDCVFYHEKVDEYRFEVSNSRRSAGRGSWERVADNFYGAFFVDDPTGAALVLPGFDSLDLGKPELSLDESPERRRSELAILQGETVSALGVPRRIDEFIQYLRQTPSANLSPALVAELMRLEKEPAAASLPCFFGRGLERVSDQPCAEYVAGTGESAAGLLQGGALLAAAGAGMVLYALKKLFWQPVSIE